MDEKTIEIIVFGSIVTAFAFFASYMADRQVQRERLETEKKSAMTVKKKSGRL